MVMLVRPDGVASALLDNVTTILLIAPVTFLVCERLGLRPVPFLMAEVFASNIGGTATLVGDPPNIIIAARADLSFNDFLVHLTPIVVVLMVAFCLLCRWLFRRDFVVRRRARRVGDAPERARGDHRPGLLVKALAVLALVVIAFVLHPVLHYEPSVVALLGAGLLLLITEVEVAEALREVEWPTLAFFAGLFIMVGGLVETGVIDHDRRGAGRGDRGAARARRRWSCSAGPQCCPRIVDNIPYVATMSPIVAELVAAGHGDGGQVLWWALALGADLGGNATAIGASANVVALGIAAREGHPIGFWEFTKYGLVVTVVSR